jgi:hypothetical protein
MDPIEAKRVEFRAQALGMTLSSYLRSLIESDLRRGGHADEFARTNMEVTLVSAMMMRKLLTHAVGSEEAKSVETWARERASEMVSEQISKGNPIK